MYLTKEAIRRTLLDVARCSTAGSVLLVNYHEPHAKGDLELLLRSVFLALWREPHIGLSTREELRGLVRLAGFEVLADTGSREWAARLGAKEPRGHTARVARLLVARRAAQGNP